MLLLFFLVFAVLCTSSEWKPSAGECDFQPECECECAFKARLLSIHACHTSAGGGGAAVVGWWVGGLVVQGLQFLHVCIHTHGTPPGFLRMNNDEPESWNWYCCTLCLCRIIIVAYHGQFWL